LLGLGLVLSLAWLPTACGSNNNNQAVFVPADSGEVTGGLTGFVGGGGGGGSSSGGSSSTTSGVTGSTTGPTASPSPGGGSGTTGGAAQPSPAAVNTTDMLSPTDNNQRKPPTRMEPIQNLIAVNQGYSLGQANGQILLVSPNAVNGTPAPILLRPNDTSPLNNQTLALTNPWDLSSDGTQNLLVTDGVGIQGQPGRVIRITNISITPSNTSTPGNATASFVNAASSNSTAIFNPLFIEPIGNGIIFVSEYMPTPQGSIRRIDLATGNSTTVVTGLSFPAGMAADVANQFLYICQNSNSNGGAQGSVIRVPFSSINGVVNGTISQPIGPSDAAVNVITVPANAPSLNRPWECKIDSGGGLIIAEGQALGDTVSGAPPPAGLAQGFIRYVRPNTTVANVVLSGLSNCAGLQFQGTAGNENLIFFVQSLPLPNGAVNSLRFDRNTLQVPTGGFLSYGSALALPIDTLPSTQGNGLPLRAAINFFGGAGNQGRVVDFR